MVVAATLTTDVAANRVMFRAWEIQLHQIGSAFENSDVPLSFRGDLSYIKKAFTAAEHALIFGEGKTADSALRGYETLTEIQGNLTGILRYFGIFDGYFRQRGEDERQAGAVHDRHRYEILTEI